MNNKKYFFRVKGAMELGLSPCLSKDEEEEPEEYKTAVSDRAGWHDINSSTSFIPPISIISIIILLANE